jgi:hypothetical protein
LPKAVTPLPVLPSRVLSPVTLLKCDSDMVGVLVLDDHRRLIAIRDIPRGTTVLRMSGVESTKPTRYSVQVGASLHIDPVILPDSRGRVRGDLWRYLDHSCEPTVVIREREVVALRNIEEGEGVTFHYCVSEWEMASPFDCRCGSPRCLGLIRGARHLPPAERKRLEKWMPDYVRLARTPRRPA